jgi:Ca-activated chloride channel family protein
MDRAATRTLLALGLAGAMSVAACGGGSPTAAPGEPTAPPSSQGTDASASPLATTGSTGEPNLEAPAEVQAGSTIDVTWTGPNAQGDFVTIVTKGTATWTNEDFFYTKDGSPGQLTAPSAAGDYELLYVSGADKSVLFRRDVKLTPFAGGLLGPDSVIANNEFEVSWTGPNGPGDYVTIVKAGATEWADQDYFYTRDGPTGKLTSPIEPGAYELWYVIGSDSTVQSRRPITVTEATATLQAPRDTVAGADIQVIWTGPNGPGDYVTIAPVGSPDTTYLSYFDTTTGSPGTLTAPATAGAYEIRYVAGQQYHIYASIPLTVH